MVRSSVGAQARLLMQLIIAAATLLGLLVFPAEAHGRCDDWGFRLVDYCDNLSLLPDDPNHPERPVLSAYCADETQHMKLRHSTLDLNQMLKNDHGKLKCKKKCGIFRPKCYFAHSCQDISLVGTAIHASCGAGNGSYVPASIDLDECVNVNNEGGLQWAYHCSSRFI